MERKIIECVPNFSEGNDLEKIREITDVIESVAGVKLLDVDPGKDTNRTVVTFVGSPDDVSEAAFLAVKKASNNRYVEAPWRTPQDGCHRCLPFYSGFGNYNGGDSFLRKKGC